MTGRFLVLLALGAALFACGHEDTDPSVTGDTGAMGDTDASQGDTDASQGDTDASQGDTDASQGDTDASRGDTDVHAIFDLLGVEITPTIAHNDSTLTCVATLDDPGAQLDVLSYRWVRLGSGDELATGASLELSPALLAADETVRCEVEAEAVDGRTATGHADRLIAGRGPVIASITLMPSVPAIGSAVRCDVDAFHPDVVDQDDMPLTLTYTWLNDANGAMLGDAQTLDVQEGDISAGQSLRCYVSVFDGGFTEIDSVASVVRTSGEAVSAVDLGTLRLVPGGVFTMGCEAGRDDVDVPCTTNEGPAHEVTLTRSYWIMETMVTRQMWSAVMGTDPSGLSDCPSCPLNSVSWTEATLFANAASAAEGLAECYTTHGSCVGTLGAGYACGGYRMTTPNHNPYLCEGYRLPTEAEFERAARGLQDFAYPGSNTPGDVLWYAENAGGVVQPVCTRARNGLQLCDMGGNSYQFTHDSGVPATQPYSGLPRTDPFSSPFSGTVSRMLRATPPGMTDLSVIRISAQGLSSGFGASHMPTSFRLVRTAQPEE